MFPFELYFRDMLAASPFCVADSLVNYIILYGSFPDGVRGTMPFEILKLYWQQCVTNVLLLNFHTQAPIFQPLESEWRMLLPDKISECDFRELQEL